MQAFVDPVPLASGLGTTLKFPFPLFSAVFVSLRVLVHVKILVQGESGQDGWLC